MVIQFIELMNKYSAYLDLYKTTIQEKHPEIIKKLNTINSKNTIKQQVLIIQNHNHHHNIDKKTNKYQSATKTQTQSNNHTYRSPQSPHQYHHQNNIPNHRRYFSMGSSNTNRLQIIDEAQDEKLIEYCNKVNIVCSPENSAPKNQRPISNFYRPNKKLTLKEQTLKKQIQQTISFSDRGQQGQLKKSFEMNLLNKKEFKTVKSEGKRKRRNLSQTRYRGCSNSLENQDQLIVRPLLCYSMVPPDKQSSHHQGGIKIGNISLSERKIKKDIHDYEYIYKRTFQQRKVSTSHNKRSDRKMAGIQFCSKRNSGKPKKRKNSSIEGWEVTGQHHENPHIDWLH